MCNLIQDLSNTILSKQYGSHLFYSLKILQSRIIHNGIQYKDVQFIIYYVGSLFTHMHNDSKMSVQMGSMSIFLPLTSISCIILISSTLWNII